MPFRTVTLRPVTVGTYCLECNATLSDMTPRRQFEENRDRSSVVPECDILYLSGRKGELPQWYEF